MRALLAAVALAVCLGASSSVAFADPGDVEATNADMPDANDPGIAALHDAINERKEFDATLRTECPNRGDAKCRAAFRAVRDAFKTAQQQAIAEHHAYRQEHKKTKRTPRPSESPRR